MEALDVLESRIETFGTLPEVFDFVRDQAIELGFVRMSYHMSPKFDAPISARTVVYTHGFPPEAERLYGNLELRKLDPIPQRTFELGRITYWADAMRDCADRPGVAQFAEAFAAFGLEHGFGIPLFGPRSRDAYASFDFGRPATEEDDAAIVQIRSLSQFAHQRICVLIETSRERPQLSERELEVLQWMARGKSTTDIGTILGISPETVRTYSQRIYLKLKASDRIGAVVKAIKLGLVEA
ncbi:helix-turn-helix transcriptional regulator [Parerythrobacter lacustris]|uniref:LuxR family transcriptional regulator n=1 Tax=Parerythrobacter lacustris TaxID=2969984 RepID=A0ABT1XSK9_9SPHN|nr:LuxR family transcriptional regulator [Parerythrobacter lacustris]